MVAAAAAVVVVVVVLVLEREQMGVMNVDEERTNEGKVLKFIDDIHRARPFF